MHLFCIDIINNKYLYILAWALVVENSALLCELLVRFPETTNSILKQPNYSEVVSWALEFLLDTKYPNENDKKLIQYAKYELNLAPRPEGYRSPFSEENVSGIVHAWCAHSWKWIGIFVHLSSKRQPKKFSGNWKGRRRERRSENRPGDPNYHDEKSCDDRAFCTFFPLFETF